jgi:hypothetical protein
MEKYEIIEMARQAGFLLEMFQLSSGYEIRGTDDEIEAFAKLVAAKYETALIDYINHVGYCEGTDFIIDIDWVKNKTSVEIIKAAAIRARGEA